MQNHQVIHAITSDEQLNVIEHYRIEFKQEPEYSSFTRIKSFGKADFDKEAKEIEKIVDGFVDFAKLQETFSGDNKKPLKKYTYRSETAYSKCFVGRSKEHFFVFTIDFNQYDDEPFMALCASESFIQTDLGVILKDKVGSEIDLKVKDHKSKVHIIHRGEFGLSLRAFKIKKFKETGVEFSDLYNDDFLEVADRIESSLTDKVTNAQNGIILLQGDVGTGKTSFLRHLIRNVNKKVIYVPPDLSVELSSPSFMAFLMEHPNSILIIEDAETVLKTREAGGNQAVSNILNISDGILGDALSLQIVCTFNASTDDIDRALLREGRLIELYEFNALSEEKTLNLCKKVYGEDVVPPKKEMTLAQIFNSEQFKRNTAKELDKPSFGFI